MALISSNRLASLPSSLLLIIWLSIAGHSHGNPFNINFFGAVPDGKTDSTKAIQKAWDAACATFGRPRVLIPDGVYLTGPLNFEGPCKGPMVLQLKGVLRAHADPKMFPDVRWVLFESVVGLLVTGGGTFDGQGAHAWPENECKKNKNCMLLPSSIKFDHCSNATIRRISSIDSKFFHINIDESKYISVHHVQITAPETSPNTDGIHVGRSSFVRITNSIIGTGDDCISIGPGSKNIAISKVTCGPGHGISIGSLGRYKGEEDVLGIKVKNCTITGTMNGLRIKTWQDSPPSSASECSFQDIQMRNVYNPIIIDQQYCPYESCSNNPPSPSRVKLSGIHFRNIKGTSASKVAVNLMCSPTVPCKNVELSDINLKYVDEAMAALANCSHVSGFASGLLSPPSCISGASSSLVTT